MMTGINPLVCQKEIIPHNVQAINYYCHFRSAVTAAAGMKLVCINCMCPLRYHVLMQVKDQAFKPSSFLSNEQWAGL